MSTKISLSFLAIAGVLVGGEITSAHASLSTVPTSVANNQSIDRVSDLAVPTEVSPLPNIAVVSLSVNQTNVSTSDVAILAHKPKVSHKSAAQSPEFSIEIPVPLPRTQAIKVPPVSHLPQVSQIPNVPAMPIVHSSDTTKSQPVADIAQGENEQGIQPVYPLQHLAPITSKFGWRTHPLTGNRSFHAGIDIGAPSGAPVVATGSGTIISAGWKGGYGKAVVIQHNGVQQTLYGHLSEVSVQAGQEITQGAVIGLVGSTGNSTGPHLHFENRISSADGWVAVDPIDDIHYAMDNLQRSTQYGQRELPPGI